MKTRNTKKTILWITRTAIFIALLVVVQYVTSAAGQYVTGSLVNLILIAAAILAGLWAGITVAVLSPVFAFLLGIGPKLLPIVPFIMLGNLSIVLVWHLIAGRPGAKHPAYFAAMAAGAVVKFLVLYVGITQFLVPHVLDLAAAQAAAMSAMFSLPQLVTAAVGGVLACLILPPLRKALKKDT